MRILVVEDDRRLAQALEEGLRENGYAVDLSPDGEEGAYLARTGVDDVVVLDILLPKKSGLAVLRELRRADVATPVLLLTALDQAEDRVTGLDLGADDYLGKPFHFSELLARLRALLRRSSALTPTTLRIADLELDPATHRVTREGQEIDLTPREFSLLEFLMRRTGTVVTRSAIVEGVWDMNFTSVSNVLEVLVSRLRRKVDQPFENPLIHTVRSVGYVLREEPA